MKSIIMPSTVQLSEEAKKQLALEVKETVANKEMLKEETFTASQMWNHQKQTRSASAMMRRWDLN